MWHVAKSSGRPLHPSLQNAIDWPFTVSQVMMLRQKYDSYLELSEPVPEEYWDHPHLVRRHIDKLYPSKKKTSADIDLATVEE